MTETQEMSEPKQSGEPRGPNFFQMVGSILSSFFGVQNSKNRKRDFTYGKAKAFLAVGILMTVVWYGAIRLVVYFVLGK